MDIVEKLENGLISEEQAYEAVICKNAIDHYGKVNQLVVALEELSELQKAITKTIRDKMDYDNVIEEIADVEIMMIQLKQIYKCEIMVDEVKKRKVDRLARRIIERGGKIDEL